LTSLEKFTTTSMTREDWAETQETKGAIHRARQEASSIDRYPMIEDTLMVGRTMLTRFQPAAEETPWWLPGDVPDESLSPVGRDDDDVDEEEDDEDDEDDDVDDDLDDDLDDDFDEDEDFDDLDEDEDFDDLDDDLDDDDDEDEDDEEEDEGDV
jgi:hypothetical protein